MAPKTFGGSAKTTAKLPNTGRFGPIAVFSDRRAVRVSIRLVITEDNISGSTDVF